MLKPKFRLQFKYQMYTDQFTNIRLEDMEKVKLMSRTDRKFSFHFEHLQELLRSISDRYYVLEIEGKNEMLYATTYYDTTINKMYTSHHNGKLNRYKIRHRSYISSALSFLEIKFKNNKGKTIKKRIPADFNNPGFTTEEREFVKNNTPFCCEDLKTSLVNEFSRITLVNKNFNERCTIDSNLTYMNDKECISLKNLVVIELKSGDRTLASPLALALRKHRIKTSGFSKYCIGKTLTDTNIKRNAFKKKVRKLEKITHANLMESNNSETNV